MKRVILFTLPVLLSSCGSCGGGVSPPEPSTTVGLETIPADEPAAIAETAKLIGDFIRKSYPEGKRPAMRDAHAKAHGCVKATVTVPELPENLRVGVFAQPRTYFAWIRYSNGNGTPQADSVGDGRGMAVKLMGVPGKKLLQAEVDATTQDFVMINYPVFFIDTAANYVTFTKDNQGGHPLEYFVGIRSPSSWHIEAAKIVEAMTALKPTNPLELRYYSMAPYLFGDKAIKLSAKPCAVHPELYTATDSPTFLADNMEKNLKDGKGCFELMVQFQKNAKDMPVEDPTKVWDEKASPFVKVAQIDIPSQSFRSEEQMKFCENLSFTPWHALPEHRPLGGINRLRKVVYETISSLRHEMNAAPRQEPSAGPDFLPAAP
jgi:hypothetical protein